MMRTSNSAGYIRMGLMGTAFIALTIVLIVFQPGSPRNAESTFEPEPSSTVTRVADPLTPPRTLEVAPVTAPAPVQVPTPMPQLATTDHAEDAPSNLRDMTFSAISNLKSVTTGEAPAPGQPGSLLHSVVQRSIANSTAAPTTAPPVTEIRPISAPRLPSTGSYFVRPGDTLLSIAKEVYDDTTMSSEIFRHNTNILTSPDSLKPGMVLKLPTP